MVFKRDLICEHEQVYLSMEDCFVNAPSCTHYTGCTGCTRFHILTVHVCEDIDLTPGTVNCVKIEHLKMLWE